MPFGSARALSSFGLGVMLFNASCGTSDSHSGGASGGAVSVGDSGGNSAQGGASTGQDGTSTGHAGSQQLSTGGQNPSVTTWITTTSPGLGAHPADGATPTVGGTMTFLDVGAAGWWPRRLGRDPSNAACTFKSGTDTWGGTCCLTKYSSPSVDLAPFDAEMTLLLKAVRVRQLAVYQPVDNAAGDFALVSSFDDRDGVSHNIWATQSGDGSATFPGDFTKDDCVWYVTQQGTFDCGNGRDYYCPNDPGIKHLGWSGTKLIVLLASMDFDDAGVKACGSTTAGSPAPWIAFVASELTRDGGRKWNGLCNCYSKTGTVGDGCGEINLFEVVMDNNSYSNREFISTGVRSFQAGHVGGNVCGSGCARSDFAADQDVVDACTKKAYSKGPTLTMGGSADGCPVWVRPRGDRYLLALLDATRRTIQVAMLNPSALPTSVAPLLPNLPERVSRSAIDSLAELRLPGG